MSDDAAFNASLIGKTNPSPYDQIIFLSQDMINKAFHSMWLRSKPKKDQKGPPLWEFSKNIHGESVDIKLNAPTVKLMVTTRQDPQLYFMMNIKSGTIKCYKSSDSDDKITFDVKGWTFGFPVKIASKILPKSDPQVTNAVKNAGFSSDVYSLAQLYLDISSSTKYDEAYNTHGDYDWNSQSADTKASYKTFVEKWFNLMQANKSTVIGYSLQVQKGAPDHATFPPTSIDYYVYPWKDPGSSSSTPTDGSPNNALCYLMMSKFATPKDVPGIEYSGAFVRTGGLFALRSDLFWGQWLIPLLQGINKGAEIITDKPPVSYDSSKPKYRFSAGMAFHVGVNGGHLKTTEPYYAFTKDTSSPRTWKWSGTERVKSNSATDGGKTKLTVTQKSTTSTTLTFDEGGQGITLNGKTVFDFDNQYFYDGKKSGEPSHLVITSDWHFKMALSSVSDGGVQLARVPEPPGGKPCNTTVEATQGDVEWEDGFEEVKNYFSNDIGSYIDNDTHDIQNELLKSLEHQDKLFLPASGTFLMKDPKFNARGDLLVTLDYNGADPPDAPKLSDTTTNKAASLTSFKASIDGPVPFSTLGRLKRITPKPVSKPAIRSVGFEIGVAA